MQTFFINISFTRVKDYFIILDNKANLLFAFRGDTISILQG